MAKGHASSWYILNMELSYSAIAKWCWWSVHWIEMTHASPHGKVFVPHAGNQSCCWYVSGPTKLMQMGYLPFIPNDHWYFSTEPANSMKVTLIFIPNFHNLFSPEQYGHNAGWHWEWQKVVLHCHPTSPDLVCLQGWYKSRCGQKDKLKAPWIKCHIGNQHMGQNNTNLCNLIIILFIA